jgi:hypothetical protein
MYKIYQANNKSTNDQTRRVYVRAHARTYRKRRTEAITEGLCVMLINKEEEEKRE